MNKKRGLPKKSFEEYYSSLFGLRWSLLSQALRAAPQQIASLNCFVRRDEKDLWLLQNNLHEELLEAPVSFTFLSSPLEIKSHNGLMLFYPMDWASAWAACLLPMETDNQGPFKILDLCAAPGGKSLILAARMSGNLEAKMVCNELSQDRRRRLQKTINDYLPPELLNRISVTGYDASRWGLHEPECYDAVLLDAPCSSERHVLNSSQALKIWTPARVENLAHRQYALLCSALMALKSGGYCLYSTCSINPIENEKTIEKLIKKKGNTFNVVKIEAQKLLGAEAAEYGYYQMPDKNLTGSGPMYVCLLQKTH